MRFTARLAGTGFKDELDNEVDGRQGQLPLATIGEGHVRRRASRKKRALSGGKQIGGEQRDGGGEQGGGASKTMRGVEQEISGAGTQAGSSDAGSRAGDLRRETSEEEETSEGSAWFVESSLGGGGGFAK